MATMAFDTPMSSMTKRVAYNPDHSVLTLHFRTGGVHHFADVPESHYHAMHASQSAGAYYHANIKGKFKAIS